MIGIIYGTGKGSTESVAKLIAEKLGLPSEVLNVKDIDADKINSYDKLIFGSSTKGKGELHVDWAKFDFSKLKLEGKTVACFGLGNAVGHAETFCDALAKLYDAAKEAGANMIDASVSTDGYNYKDTISVRDGKFIGLAIDSVNQADLTPSRVDAWVEKIKPSFE
ncbi:flavodoxin [Campylobacter pinnipediorum]|uniref:flavodoxin n=1 Tax=Campylobacter pinnipediorum TaxID=1965231 RepID=UPI000B0266D3